MVNTTQDSRTEEKYAALNYVITFYKDLQQLLHHQALLINLLAEVNGFGEVEEFVLKEEQKPHIKAIIDGCRYHATKCRQFIIAMKDETKLSTEEEKKIESAYDAIIKEWMPSLKALDDLIIILNKFFVKNVAKNLLENNADLISKIYTQSP